MINIFEIAFHPKSDYAPEFYCIECKCRYHANPKLLDFVDNNNLIINDRLTTTYPHLIKNTLPVEVPSSVEKIRVTKKCHKCSPKDFPKEVVQYRRKNDDAD